MRNQLAILGILLVWGAQSAFAGVINPPASFTAIGLPSAYSVKTYGAHGDTSTVSDAAISASSATLSSATAGFTAADVGKYVSVAGAGVSGATLVTTISGYTNSTTVTLAANASTTVSGATMIWGHDDTTAIQDALTAAANTGGEVYVPAGTYTISSALLISSHVWLKGAGPDSTVIQVKSGANCDGLDTSTFATDTGTTNTGQVSFKISDICFDGNKANNSAGYGWRLYGADYRFDNCQVRYFAQTGIYSEWGNSGTPPDSMEAFGSNTKVHHCGNNGILWLGPHDSHFRNLISYDNGAVDGTNGASGFLVMGPKSVSTQVAVNSSGGIAGVACGGQNYTSASGTVIGDGTGATVSLTISGGRIISSSTTAQGTGYTYAYVTVSGTGNGAFGVCTISSGHVSSVSWGQDGGGFLPWGSPTATLSGGGGSGGSVTPVPGANGQIVGYTIVAAGSSYSTTAVPTISVSGGQCYKGGGGLLMDQCHAWGGNHAYGMHAQTEVQCTGCMFEAGWAACCLLDCYTCCFSSCNLYATFGASPTGVGLQIGSKDADANGLNINCRIDGLQYYAIWWNNSTGNNVIRACCAQSSSYTNFVLGTPNANDQSFIQTSFTGTNQTPLYATSTTSLFGNVTFACGGQKFTVTNATNSVFQVNSAGTVNIPNGYVFELWSDIYSTSTGQWNASNGHLISGGTNTPTFSWPATVSSVTGASGGNDLADTVTVVCNSSAPGTQTELCHVAFRNSYASTPKGISVTPLNSEGAKDVLYVQNLGTSGFDVYVNNAATSSATVIFSYLIVQ